MTQQRGGQGEENLAQRGGERSAQTPGSASNIAEQLRGVNFPCNKQELMRHAQQGNASQEVRTMLNSLPERTYNSMADVMAAWGQERK